MRLFVYLGTLIWLMAGCGFQAYRPRPIAADSVRRTYQARTLADTGLRAYLRQVSHARSVDSTQFLDWPTLIHVAYYFHPDLDVARRSLALEKARLLTARQRPNPRIGVNIGYNYTPGELPLQPWLFTPALDIVLETAGKRDHRIGQVRQQIEGARLQVGIVAWQVRSRLRQQVVSYLLTEAEGELVRQEFALRSEYTDSLQTLVNFGVLTTADLELSRIALTETRLRLAGLASRQVDQRALLAGGLGLPVDRLNGHSFTFTDINQPLRLSPDSVAKLIRDAPRHNLTVRKGLIDYAVTEAALRLEVARQYPDLQVGTSLRFYQGQRRWQLTPGTDLPIFNHNQGPMAEARANREVVATRFDQLQAGLIADLDRLFALYQAQRTEYETADALLADTQNRERVVTSAFDAGELTYIDLLSVRLQTLLARQGLVRTGLSLQTTLGNLEALVQQPLDGQPGPLPNLETNPREDARRSP